MLRPSTFSRAATAIFLLASVSGTAAPMTKSEFRAGMRKLWEDHVTWTRIYIVDAAADLPSKSVTADRLLRNQSDIGGAIKPFYGEAAGDKLTALLKDHILIAAELIDAAKTGQAAKKEAAAKKWEANADEIAAFLSGANPQNWPATEMRKHMHDHLDLTTAEVTARLTKDWDADIAAYDKIHEQILQMADMLSSGIIKQHADKFA